MCWFVCGFVEIILPPAGDARCAVPRRIGEDFDSLPLTLLDLPNPSPDDQGLRPLEPGAVYRAMQNPFARGKAPAVSKGIRGSLEGLKPSAPCGRNSEAECRESQGAPVA